MIKEDEILKLLSKYGFSSSKKEPFLYQKDNLNAIYFNYKDILFGNIERIFKSDNKEDIEDFLEKYYWYKKNGAKYQVSIKLDNYETLTPKVFFVKDNEPLTKKDMLDLTKNLNLKKDFKLEQKYQKKLKRTIIILIEVIKEKIKTQNITYQNLIKLSNEFIKKQNELFKLLQIYDKKERQEISEINEEKINTDYKEMLDNLKDELLLGENKEVLEDNIKYVTSYIKSLEIEEGFLKNKYELIKIPLEIAIVKEKIKTLKVLIEKKKSLFGKKESLDQLLTKIEEGSTLKNIVTYKQYQKNELDRIEDKYAILPNLDPRTIGDYFVEFDNLKIKDVKISDEQPLIKQDKSFEETMEFLENSFFARPKKEQELLIELAYFSKKNKDLTYLMNELQNPNNIMIKIKYFKNLDFTTKEKFENSLKQEFLKLDTLKEDNLLSDINIFFKAPLNIEEKKYLKASTKRILAPLQNKEKNPLTYYANLKKSSHIYFVPNEIINDLSQDDTLKVEKNKPFFFINLEKNNIIDENSAIIKVTDFEGLSKIENDITIIKDMIPKKTACFKTIEIERGTKK